ncbi:MAG: CoA transferase [Alphaproteobacteria bacterium]|nr:CoA transferase [Alphaproteobacteria bacterium]
MNRPLEGLLVVSLEQAVAAPFLTARLADAGARVIKLERKEDDALTPWEKIMRLIPVIAISLILAVPASARDLVDRLTACAAIDPDDKRLECYDRLVPAEEDTAAIGSTAVIGSATINLAAPDGWCRLEPEKLSDARLISLLSEGMERVGNSFVVVYAECGELERWRSARQRTLDNYSIVTFGKALREFDYPGSNASFVSELRKTMEAADPNYMDDLMARVVEVLEEALPLVKLGKTKNLGLLGEDEDSLYEAMIVPATTEFGDTKVVVVSNGTTLLRRKILYTHLYTPYEGAEVLPRLLDNHKKWTARLRAAN